MCMLTAVVCCGFGCGGDKGLGRYAPPPQTARQALETALTTWKSGGKYETITTSKPTITVYDSRWRDGAKLTAFEILEAVTGGEHPQFKVRITLEGESPEELTYRVVGIDPLNVFRDADYQQATGGGG